MSTKTASPKKPLAQLLSEDVARQRRLPHDFGAALDALRELREVLIRLPGGEWWATRDQMAVLEEYVFERATPEEMHERANRARALRGNG